MGKEVPEWKKKCPNCKRQIGSTIGCDNCFKFKHIGGHKL
jgi:hypothetical protein